MTRDPRQQFAAWCVVLCVFAAVGCASVQERVADTDNRVDTLEVQIADLHAAQHNITLRLTEIRQELQGGIGPVVAQPGEPAPDPQALQSEIGALGEQLLTLTEQVAALSALLADVQVQVQQQAERPPVEQGLRQQAERQPAERGREQQPAELQPTEQGQEQPPAENQPAEQDVPPAPSADSAMFDVAFADYMAAEYVLAVDGFEEYLHRFSTTEKADEALYWIGESLAAQERHSEARGRFLRLILEYPESEMVAGARLRAALEAIEIGQPDAAIQELRSVVNYHPGTDALLVACMQLERMQEQLPDGCPR